MSDIDLQDLIDSIEKSIDSMDLYVKNRNKFNDDIKLEIERYSWELYRTKNELRALQRIYGE